MSDQTTFHDVECLCADDHLEVSIKECLEKYQAYSPPLDFQVLRDNTMGGYADTLEIKENQHFRLLDILRELLVILFPSHAEKLDTGVLGHDSLPVLLHKSNGYYMQSMIWNPGGMYKNKDD